MRRFSNLGHAIEGAMLGTGAVLCSPSEARLRTAKKATRGPVSPPGRGSPCRGGWSL